VSVILALFFLYFAARLGVHVYQGTGAGRKLAGRAITSGWQRGTRGSAALRAGAGDWWRRHTTLVIASTSRPPDEPSQRRERRAPQPAVGAVPAEDAAGAEEGWYTQGPMSIHGPWSGPGTAPRPAPAAAQPPAPQQALPSTPNGRAPAVSTGAAEKAIEGIAQIHAEAAAGNIHAKHAAIKAMNEVQLRFAALSAMLARQLAEPGMHYGPEITEPLNQSATHLQAAAMTSSEADSALTTLINTTVGDLARSARQAPHHAELAESAR